MSLKGKVWPGAMGPGFKSQHPQGGSQPHNSSSRASSGLQGHHLILFLKASGFYLLTPFDFFQNKPGIWNVTYSPQVTPTSTSNI